MLALTAAAGVYVYRLSARVCGDVVFRDRKKMSLVKLRGRAEGQLGTVRSAGSNETGSIVRAEKSVTGSDDA